MGLPQIPLKCEVLAPDHSGASQHTLPRWSNTYVETPAIIIRPDAEDDIVVAVKYAKENNLTLVTANGGRAPFVPITSKTLYLDMERFNQVTLDKSSGTVRIGGGASTEDVINSLTAKEYYTLWPNSNAVGYVGCLLGGGSSTVNGLHGYLIDAVESIQLITADCVKLEVGPHSEREERILFNALCGAGFGLAVVTSVVMKAFPIASMGLTDNGIWTRRVTLPATAIDVAAQTFASMRQLPPALTLTIVCARAPPTSATPLAPLIMMVASYFGPPSEGEQAVPALFDDSLTSQALSAETKLIPFAEANLPLKPLSANSGHKGFSGAFLDTIDAESIQEAFARWLKLGEQYEDASPTTLIFNKWDAKAIIANGQTEVGRAKFFEHRHQSMVANAMRWCTKTESIHAVDKFGEDFLHIVRRTEKGPPKCFANNQRPGMDMEELYSREKLVELRRIKSKWDPHGVFWSPTY